MHFIGLQCCFRKERNFQNSVRVKFCQKQNQIVTIPWIPWYYYSIQSVNHLWYIYIAEDPKTTLFQNVSCPKHNKVTTLLQDSSGLTLRSNDMEIENFQALSQLMINLLKSIYIFKCQIHYLVLWNYLWLHQKYLRKNSFSLYRWVETWVPNKMACPI